MVVLEHVQGSPDVNLLFGDKVTVPPASKMGRWDRINVIGDKVSELVELHEPSMVVIEGYGQGRHGGVQSFIKLVEVGSIVRLVLWGNGLDWIEVPPQSLKKFVTGRGQLPSGAKGKKVMVGAVQKNWGFSAPTHDVADAYGLARLGLALTGVVPCLPEQVDTLDKLAASCN